MPCSWRRSFTTVRKSFRSLRLTLAGLALAVAATAELAGSDVPVGWKVTRDPSGSFQVATPADWQLGRDFFLKLETKRTSAPAPGPRRPPILGLALWGVDGHDPKKIAQLPKGHWYQFRKLLVHGDAVCSFWCVKESTDFTPEENSTMAQVGNTLRWVRK